MNRLLLVLAFAGCGERSGIPNPDTDAHDVGVVTDIFEQAAPLLDADILFAVDRSKSMQDEAARVPQNMGAFMTALAGIDLDFHVAAAVGDRGCIAGPEPFIDGSFGGEAAAAMEAMIDYDRALVPYGSNEENGFAVLEAALSSEATAPGGCNATFLRPDASLSIIVVSDEPERSVEGWQHYVAAFRDLKPNPDQVVVHAIAGPVPDGCATAEPGDGWYEAATATGGAFLNICAPNWYSHLETLAERSMYVQDKVGLSQRPVTSTLQVTVDGITMKAGWTYLEQSNTVRFYSDYIPVPGASIEVSYTPWQECES